MKIGFGVCGLSLGVLLYLFSVVFFFTRQLCCGEGNTGRSSTDSPAEHRTLQGRDMTLSVAVADAPTNSRGPVLAREGLCAATNSPY